MTDISFLGEFWGHDFSSPKLDGILAYCVPKKDLEVGRGLYDTKWWDYRFIHPGHAYLLFSADYVDTAKEWRTKFGVNPFAISKVTSNPIYRIEKAKRLGAHRVSELSDTPRDRVIPTPPIYRTSIWRAMCFADTYGVPYEQWIGYAFEHAFDEKWQHMPTPAGLYGQRTIEYILNRWEQDKSELMVMPENPRYLSANFVGDPTQIAFQKWLLGYIKQRPNPPIALANFLTNEPLADLGMARVILGDSTVAEALKRC